MTLQALSESNRRLWLEAMDGKEPVRNSDMFISCCLLLCTRMVSLVPIFVNGALFWWVQVLGPHLL